MVELFALFVVAGVVFGLAIAVWSHIKEKFEEREQRKAHANRRWDPALCEHEWRPGESGTCMPDYSSVGANPQVTWHVHYCPHCDAKLFECDISCQQYGKCKELHEAGSSAPGEITSTPKGVATDAHGMHYAVYRLKDRFGNERTGYRRIVPVTHLDRCPDCGGSVMAIGAERVRPGGVGDAPSAYRCDSCAREEDADFGVARVSYEEAPLTFETPEGLHKPLRGTSHGTTPADVEDVCPTCQGVVEFDPDILKPQPMWIGTDSYGGVDQPDDPWGMWVCERCGRAEEDDFSVRCAHEWEVLEQTSDIRFPPGVDMCTENLIFADEVEITKSRCSKCGKEKTEEAVRSTGAPC